MKCPKRVWIVYASQTGKSERLCYNVRDELWKVGVVGYPTSIDQFEGVFFDYFEEECDESIEKKMSMEFPLTIFILSTAGQGEVPDTMVSFWNRFLQNNLSSVLIRRLSFTIFGMGDRCFGNERFNITARKLRHLLLSYGAVERIPWGLGDESHDFGILGEYDPWIENLIRICADNDDHGSGCFGVDVPINKYKCQMWSCDSNKLLGAENVDNVGDELEMELNNSMSIQKRHISGKNKRSMLFPNISRVVYNQECDKESKTRRIKKIRFGLSGEMINYSPGTHVAVWPVNPLEKVLQFIDLFNKQMDPKILVEVGINEDYYKCLCGRGNECEFGNDLSFTKYRRCYVNNDMDRLNSNFPIGEKMTIFTLVYRYLDIMSIPERRFVARCYESAGNKIHKNRLKEMIQKSVDSKRDYCDYIRDEHRNHLELLWDFDSVQLEMDDIVNFIPVIIPRYYSVCNTAGWYELNLWRYIEYEDYMRRMSIGLVSEASSYNSNTTGGMLLLPEILSNTLGVLLPRVDMNNSLKVINDYEVINRMRAKAIEKYRLKAKERYLDAMMEEYKSMRSDYGKKSGADTMLLEICVNVIEWSTVFNRRIRGLCSGYLDEILCNTSSLIAFENKISDQVISELVDPKVPVLLISCGLGITGIISILQERVIRILRENVVNVGEEDKNKTLVYIGLRYSNVMYPYLDQISEFSRRMELLGKVRFNISYSRRNPGLKESIFNDINQDHKVVNLNQIRSGCYIQSLLLNEEGGDGSSLGEDLREYIVNCVLNGYIFLCGNALSMPMEIRETLARILVEMGKFETVEDSLVYIKRLIRYGRYIEETWV